MIFTWYNDFWHKRKLSDFDPYNALLAIATNIPVLLLAAFVVQGRIECFGAHETFLIIIIHFENSCAA